jgi:two-component system response regulator FixJ
MDAEVVVFVISGDSKTRRNLSLRLKLLGYTPRLCHSPEDFQQNALPHDAGCILLHVAHAELDLDWLAELGRPEDHWPVIGIAADAGMETAVLAMKRGACDFLLEACGDQRLQAGIDEALRRVAARRKHIALVQSIRRRLRQLAPPLREVFELLVRGKPNREIAEALGKSVRLIEVRRAKVMHAMKARTLAALVRQAMLVGAEPKETLAVPGVGPSDEQQASVAGVSAKERTAARVRQTR